MLFSFLVSNYNISMINLVASLLFGAMIAIFGFFFMSYEVNSINPDKQFARKMRGYMYAGVSVMVIGSPMLLPIFVYSFWTEIVPKLRAADKFIDG